MGLLNIDSKGLGEMVTGTVGKVIGALTDKYLPASMTEKEKADFRMEAAKLAQAEADRAIADVRGARELAMKESEGAPGWTKILTVTHRPIWALVVLAIFTWTILAPYLGYPNIPLSEVHKDVMMTVIVFYFGGRSVEKTAKMIWK